VFVGRDAELAQLESALRDALGGHGCVRFVIGEAGSGKTALARTFVSRAEEHHPDLLVVMGQSDAQTGIGDPYLPFREVLALLTGDVDDPVARGVITAENAGRLQRFLGVSGEALLDLGPDLIGTIIPGAGLVTRAAAYIAKKSGKLEKLEELAERSPVDELDSGGIEQSHIFEQYTNVMIRLAEHRPLVVVLDDLHWADVASIGLLFRLGRSLGGSRVLLLGTYRPAEVAIGRNGERHPLEKVIAEFKRYLGDIDVDLADAGDDERRRLVDALLDLEPNRLGDTFRRALFHHTGGHPLFTVELLRTLQERGELALDGTGRWVEGPSLHWDTVPARVEGVIEERIGRLDEDAQEALTVASVEGEQFTAEVVAAVQEVDARRLVRRFGRDLEQRHRLVRSQGLRHMDGDGLRLSLFAFRHNLFQRYLYTGLSEADRAYLHEEVGNALETLCADSGDDFVVQLARHFVEAGISGKARHYLRRAGELSLERHANEEAADYLARALELTPDGELEDRWRILEARERALQMLGRRQEQCDALAHLRRLAEKLGDDTKRAEVAIRIAVFANATGDYPEALASAEEAIRAAGAGRDVVREARAQIEWGRTLHELGRLDEAESRVSHALALAESAALHRIEATALVRLADIAVDRGEFAVADRDYRQALRVFDRLNDVLGSASAYNNLGIASTYAGDLDRGVQFLNTALALARRVGDLSGEGRYVGNLAELAAERENYATAQIQYERALEIHRLAADQRGECVTLVNLGGLATKLGRYDAAQQHLNLCLDIARRIGHLSMAAHALAWLGLMQASRGSFADACDCARQALRIAEEVADPRLEAYCLDFLGQGLEGLELWDEAAAAYERSVELRVDIGQDNGVVEAKAGLARISMWRGDVSRAQSVGNEILAHLESSDVFGTERPCAIYLTCYRVLHAVGDSRAHAVLGEGHEYLMQIADRIEDPAVRCSFLDNVAPHRELLRLAELYLH
jgi:predicted ATPase